MNILILGSGGREYSIGLAISKEKSHNLYFYANRNGATSNLGTNINKKTIQNLLNLQKKNNIELTIVGPEAPL